MHKREHGDARCSCVSLFWFVGHQSRGCIAEKWLDGSLGTAIGLVQSRIVLDGVGKPREKSTNEELVATSKCLRNWLSSERLNTKHYGACV